MKDDREFKWNQFEKLIDLHKFYFENIIKAAAFSFGIIGAIFTYVIKAELSESLIRVSLVLPFILSAGTCLVFDRGITQANQFSNWVDSMMIDNQLNWKPHAEILPEMCKLFKWLFLAISFGLVVVFIKPSII